MKTLTTIAVAAALVGGISIAQAQHAPTTKVETSPNSLNKGSLAATNSGSQASAALNKRVEGKGKFCQQGKSSLDCRFASLSACNKASKSDSLHCVANPKTGATTGSK